MTLAHTFKLSQTSESFGVDWYVDILSYDADGPD